MSRPLCPQCAFPVDAMRPSPSPPDKEWRAKPLTDTWGRAHLVAAYPCGCWLPPDIAIVLVALHRAAERGAERPGVAA